MTKVTEARRKSISIANKERNKRIREENNYTGKDMIEFKIESLKNTIRNCQYDLDNGLGGNLTIIRKIESAKEQLKLREEEMKKLMEETK